MLSSPQSKNITYVYNKLIESELTGWTKLDDYLELLEYLEDDQLYIETEVLFSQLKDKKMGCTHKHNNNSCFIKNIAEAVESIIELYQETNDLHPKNRYILSYYLAIYQDGQMVELL
jgi:hypothetical protein